MQIKYFTHKSANMRNEFVHLKHINISIISIIVKFNNHHYLYHHSNNNSAKSMFNNDSNTNNKSPKNSNKSRERKQNMIHQTLAQTFRT